MDKAAREVDVRPDFAALESEVLALISEDERAAVQQIFANWQLARGLVPELAAVEVVVAGEPHRMETGGDETFRQLRDRALAETGHDERPYPPPDEWELRNQVGVLIVDLDRPARALADRGWPRLWLNQRAGSGS